MFDVKKSIYSFLQNYENGSHRKFITVSFGFGFRRNAVIVAFSISFSLSFQKKISNENFKKIFIIFEFF